MSQTQPFGSGWCQPPPDSPLSPPPTSSSSKTKQTFQICHHQASAYLHTHVPSFPLLGTPSLPALAWRTHVQPSKLSSHVALRGLSPPPLPSSVCHRPASFRRESGGASSPLAVLTAPASKSTHSFLCPLSAICHLSLSPKSSCLLVTGLPAFPPPSPVTLCPFSSQDPGGPCENLSQTLLPSCSPPQELPAAPLLGAALCPGVCRALEACATCLQGLRSSLPSPAQGLHSLLQTHQSRPSHTVFLALEDSLHTQPAHRAPYQPFCPSSASQLTVFPHPSAPQPRPSSCSIHFPQNPHSKL